LRHGAKFHSFVPAAVRNIDRITTSTLRNGREFELLDGNFD